MANDSLHTLIAWDLKARTSRRIAEQALGPILAVSPDGAWVAFAEIRRPADDRLVPSHRILVWDLARQKLAAAIEPDDLLRPDVASFSADGKALNVLIGYGAFRANERRSFHGQDRGLYRFSLDGERPKGGDISATVVGSKARTWTDATGQFSPTAEFVELSLGKVTLRKANGATVRIPLKRLSESDQLYKQNTFPGSRDFGRFQRGESLGDRRPPWRESPFIAFACPTSWTATLASWEK